MQPEILSREVSALLGLPGAAPAPRIEPLAAGGNNRVFLATAGDRKYAVKVYFRHPSDRRDRLHAEYTFLQCAAGAGIDCVPRPVACDARHGIGVYEYIDGDKLAAAEIRAEHVDSAAKFFSDLNSREVRAQAAQLPEASEACFSIDAHLAMVDGRIARLDRITGTEPVDGEARDFASRLATRWAEAKRVILEQAAAAGIQPGEALAERCISPSDFGFHNAITMTGRGLCFIDFEYAGWDDPAKLVGDFFSHPAVPVDMSHRDRFMDQAFEYSTQPRKLRERARLLFPVFQVKWCCIILNEFLPEAAERRRFADPHTDFTARKRAQLEKAARLFGRIAG